MTPRQRWITSVIEPGCALCRKYGHSGVPAEFHHPRAGTGKGQKAHWTKGLALCVQHHRDGKESVHGAGIRAWERMHGTTEAELLAWVQERDGAPFEYRPKEKRMKNVSIVQVQPEKQWWEGFDVKCPKCGSGGTLDASDLVEASVEKRPSGRHDILCRSRLGQSRWASTQGTGLSVAQEAVGL